jgi:hypothetical protein
MCNCSCSNCEPIEALTGEQGEEGTSTGIVAGGVTIASTSVEFVRTANRDNTSSDSIASNYDWTVVTIPDGVGASNIVTFSADMQINATDVHIVTITALETGSGLAISGFERVQSCGTREAISVRFQTTGVTAGQIYAIRLDSDAAGVTPVLKGANCEVTIYSA